MASTMTEKDWLELKRLLGDYSDRKDSLDQIRHTQNELCIFEHQFKAAITHADSAEDIRGAKKGIAEVRKQQNLLFDHECLVRSDLLGVAKEMDFLLHKCFSDGLLCAFSDEPFMEAVEKTMEAVYDTCDHNPFELADSRGSIASALAQRYYKFLDLYPKEQFNRNIAISVFAELQGMPAKSAKKRIDQAMSLAVRKGITLNIWDDFKNEIAETQGLTKKQIAEFFEQAKIDIHFEERAKELAEVAYKRMQRREKNQPAVTEAIL